MAGCRKSLYSLGNGKLAGRIKRLSDDSIDERLSAADKRSRRRQHQRLKETTLTVRASKTDQEGTGESLYVCDATLQVLNQYRERANITRGALFRHIRRGDNSQPTRLHSHSARRIIKKRAAHAGVEGFISGHSLRVRSAVSLAQAGATVVDMQGAGRWKSSQMPAHYAKAELAERGVIARFKDGKR